MFLVSQVNLYGTDLQAQSDILIPHALLLLLSIYNIVSLSVHISVSFCSSSGINLSCITNLMYHKLPSDKPACMDDNCTSWARDCIESTSDVSDMGQGLHQIISALSDMGQGLHRIISALSDMGQGLH